MKTFHRSAAFALLLIVIAASSARGEDSMASFKALVEYFSPMAADIGGMVTPEILYVTSYPAYPQAGDRVVIRARVNVYNSMVPYKIAKVELAYTIEGKSGKKSATAPMKVEDAEQGIYRVELPVVADGDEVSYAVDAVDDWGNTAVELLPGAPMRTVVGDTVDAALPAQADILRVEASFDDAPLLKLCMETREKAKTKIGKDLGIYGMAIYANDVRYKPFLTETEFSAAWLGAYFPYLNLRDITPASELLSAVSGGKDKPKRSEFSQDGNKICFAFNPETLREEYYTGIKVAGLTIGVNLAPMTPKPMDATAMAMIYPGGHSFKVARIR